MATVVNARDTALQAVTPRVLPVALPSNIVVPTDSVPGLNDIYDSSRQIILKASSLLFQVPKSGATLPLNISMTAVLKNITGAVTFTVESGTCTFTANGNTITILPTGLTSTSATIKASVTYDSVVYEDRVTIAKTVDGTDSVVGLLSNEACVLSTPFDGTITDFTKAGGTFFVFDGLTNKTGNAAVTYSVASSSNVTISIANTGVYTVTALSADNGSATLRAVYNGVTIDKTYTIAKAKSGQQAQLVTLQADSQVFQVSKAGQANPTQITLSAISNNLAGNPTFSVLSGTATLTGTGSSRIITYSNMTTDTVTVQVTWDGKTDTITLVKVREGVDSVIGFLTNEAALIPADSTGTLTGSLSGVGGTFKVYSGVMDVTGNGVTYSVAATSNMSATIASTGLYTITGITADAGSVTFRAVYNGVTIDKVYSLAKAKAGSIGVDGKRGTVNISRAITGSTWSDSEAILALSSGGFGAPVNRDIVTLYNASAGYSQTKFYDNASVGWLTLDAYISGNLLLDGSVSSNSLTTGAVQAKHLSIANGRNILANSGPANGTANWTTGNNNTGYAFTGFTNDPTYATAGSNSIALAVNGLPTVGTVFDLFNNNAGRKYPVKGNQRYELSAYISAWRCTAQLRVFWYNSAGTLVREDAVGNVVSTGQVNTTGLDSFSRGTGFITSPSTAVSAVFAVRATCTGGSSIPYIFVSMAFMGEANQYQTDYTPWSEGGVTTITPTMIQTSNLSAISSDLGAVTAGSLNINNKFIVASDGTTTIQSAPSGQRVVMTNSLLSVYDSNGTLRVRLGIW